MEINLHDLSHHAVEKNPLPFHQLVSAHSADVHDLNLGRDNGIHKCPPHGDR